MNNRKAINDFRIAHGLAPIMDTPEQAAAKRAKARARSANRAAHSALQKQIRDIRNRNRKG